MSEISFSKRDKTQTSQDKEAVRDIQKYLSFLPKELIDCIVSLPPDVAYEISNIPIAGLPLTREYVGDLITKENSETPGLSEDEIGQLLPEEKKDLLNLLTDRVVIDLERYLFTCEKFSEVQEGVLTFLDIWWQNRTRSESEVIVVTEKSEFFSHTYKMYAVILRYFSAKQFVQQLLWSMDLQKSFVSLGWRESSKMSWGQGGLQENIGKPIPGFEECLEAFERGLQMWMDIHIDEPALFKLEPASSNQKKDKLIEHAKNYVQSYKDAYEAYQNNERNSSPDFASMQAEMKVLFQLLLRECEKKS